MALITYTDKANLNSLSTVNAENKVSDTDMNEIKQVVNDNWNAVKDFLNVKAVKVDFSITPSGGTTTIGAGSTSVDISSLNANVILGLTFDVPYSYLVCGCATDFTTNPAPSSLAIYGYRLTGKYTSAMSASVIITYM